MMRLDKLLSHSGYGSRKDVKKIITSGAIAVNGETVKKVGYNVDPEVDQVTYYNDPIHYQEFYYVMMNKPDGIISATEDRIHQTVIDWVELDYGHIELFPVGRLDIDTTGLLLLTNNGQLAHQLLSPKKSVNKTYQARVSGIVNEKDIESFSKGMDLGDFRSLPAKLEILEVMDDSQETWAEVTIQEGKFHQVKRMFEKVDKQVLELHRIKMGPLVLDPELDLGDYRELTDEERLALEPYGLE